MQQNRLEELKKKREELMKKKELQMKDFREHYRQAHNEPTTPTRIQQSTANDANASQKQAVKYPITPSNEVVLLTHKQEEKKIMLEEGVMANFELDNQKLQAEDDYFSDSSESDPEAKADNRFTDLVGNVALINAARFSVSKSKPDAGQFKQLTDAEIENLFNSRQTSLMSFFQKVERMIKDEQNQKGKEDLIEDYIFNQDKDVREQKEGCTVKKIEDGEVEGKYMVNDIAWMKSNLYETEKIAVCYSKLPGLRETSFDKHDFLIGVYSNEKRVETKTSRAEIKKICADDEDDVKILGGLDNGRVAVWDLRTEKTAPDMISKIGEKSNYLPIIDIKKRGDEVFTVGLEGRICKWDARKFEEPLFFFDTLCLSEGNSLAQLESMPMSMEMDPVEKDLIYVTTFEGSVYELLIGPNNFQQRNFLPDLHSAPISRLKVMDFKNFFKEQAQNKKNAQYVNPSAKFVNHFLTCSFDWSIKLFKGSLANEINTFRYHNDFVTCIDVNSSLCPFTFASSDAEGRLAVWKLDSNNLDMPIFEWSNTSAISKIAWNMTGLKLAVGDVKGGVNTLSFPKNKLLIPERTFTNYLSSGLLNLKKA